MRTWVFALMIAAVSMLLVWRCQSEPTPPAQRNPIAATHDPPRAPSSPPPGHHTPSTASAPIPRPELSPVIPGAVTLRREPRLPEETDLQYEWRTQFVVAFDWFRSATSISEEKEQRLLRLLAQAQAVLVDIESKRPPLASPDTALWDAYIDWASVYSARVRGALDEQIALLLTPDEYAAWKRYVKDLVLFHLDHAQPLRIQPTPAG